MLKLTELVYLAAPFDRPEERAFNDDLAELVRSYNFPLLMPQEMHEELAAEAGTAQGAQLDEAMLETCMEALNRANLVIAVAYGEEFDPLTAFEVGYALGRRTNVVAIRNDLYPELSRPGSVSCRVFSPGFCSRIVIAPHEPDRFPDRLIPILNRFFVPNGISPA